MPQFLLQFSHLFLSFGQRPLFHDISLSISQGIVTGLIGENGAGKTTLLKVLNGSLLPDAGKISRNPCLRVGFLPQEISIASSGVTPRMFLEEGPLTEIERQMTACLQDPDRLEEWAELHEKYEQFGGYQRIPLEEVLRGLKLDPSLLDVSMEMLSSGQKIRMALAQALMGLPEILLLDEPTNHLDTEMLDWLEGMLRNRKGATVIVSHDRRFLNRVCNRLIEIKNGSLSCYGGNYDFYLDEKKRSLQKAIKEYEEQQEEKKQLKQKIKQLTFSKRKAPPASDRNFMAYDRRGEHHQKSTRRNLEVLKARLSAIHSNPLPHPKPKTVKGLHFFPVPLASSIAIDLDKVALSYEGKKLFSNFSKSVGRGNRVIILGPNGSGKTSLMKCMAGLAPFHSGKMTYAPTARIAYLDQEVELLPMEENPFDYFEAKFNLSNEGLRGELHKAGIGSSELLALPFSTLSIGQRKRLMLLSLILDRPNVLLLDEPTNHLDLTTLEAFEEALMDFEGALVAISHDQAFINKIGTQMWYI